MADYWVWKDKEGVQRITPYHPGRVPSPKEEEMNGFSLWSFITGVFVGCNLGVLLFALLVAASKKTPKVTGDG